MPWRTNRPLTTALPRARLAVAGRERLLRFGEQRGGSRRAPARWRLRQAPGRPRGSTRSRSSRRGRTARQDPRRRVPMRRDVSPVRRSVRFTTVDPEPGQWLQQGGARLWRERCTSRWAWRSASLGAVAAPAVPAQPNSTAEKTATASALRRADVADRITTAAAAACGTCEGPRPRRRALPRDLQTLPGRPWSRCRSPP